MPSYEFECVNEACEANVHIDKPVSKSKEADLECPFCYESMSLVYVNAEI
jgi:hypothetical protein